MYLLVTAAIWTQIKFLRCIFRCWHVYSIPHLTVTVFILLQVHILISLFPQWADNVNSLSHVMPTSAHARANLLDRGQLLWSVAGNQGIQRKTHANVIQIVSWLASKLGTQMLQGRSVNYQATHSTYICCKLCMCPWTSWMHSTFWKDTISLSMHNQYANIVK